MTYQTGWFGIPARDGRYYRGGRVHALRDGKPICGEHIHPKAGFQQSAPGIVKSHIECRRCLERIERKPRPNDGRV